MFMVSFISSVAAFVTLTDFGTVTSILWSASTPESLLLLKTYARAVRLAFNSGGLAVCGVMSAASFRSKFKNSYRLATVMVVSNVATSFLSLLATLSICGNLADNSYQRTFSSRTNPNIFVIGIVTEAVITKTNNTFWAVVFTFAYVMAKILPFFALIMVTAAITRDFRIGDHRWSRRVGVVGSVCIAGFVVSVIRSVMPLKVYVAQLLPDVRSTYEVVIPVAMLVIFVVIYGEFEYVRDLWELYPEDKTRYCSIKPTSGIYMNWYNFLPLMCSLLAIVDWLDIEKKHAELNLNVWPYRMIVYAIAAIIVGYPLPNIRKTVSKGEWSFLHSITPEHPSYFRSTTENIHEESIIIPTSMLKAINARKQLDTKENENATAKALNAGASLRQKGRVLEALAISHSKNYTSKSDTNKSALTSKHASKSRRQSSRNANKRRSNAKHGTVQRRTPKRRQSAKERSRPKSRKSGRSKRKTLRKLSLPASKASSSSEHQSTKGTPEEAKTQTSSAKLKSSGSPLQYSAEKTRSTKKSE